MPKRAMPFVMTLAGTLVPVGRLSLTLARLLPGETAEPGCWSFTVLMDDGRRLDAADPLGAVLDSAARERLRACPAGEGALELLCGPRALFPAKAVRDDAGVLHVLVMIGGVAVWDADRLPIQALLTEPQLAALDPAG